MTSLFFTCEIGLAGWQKSLRELTAGAEKKVQQKTQTAFIFCPLYKIPLGLLIYQIQS